MPIRVFCRLKDNNDQIEMKRVSEEITNISIPYSHKNFEFQVNQIWGGSDNQQVFETLMKKSNYQKNYWILFGFTGTGKTYTTMSILNQLLSNYQQKITVSAYQISAKTFQYVHNQHSIFSVRTSAIFLTTFSDCINDSTDIVSSAHVSKSVIQTQVCGFGLSR